MNFFPTNERTFKLYDTQAESLERLQRRTEKSENLTSQRTNKSFVGIINGNQFKLISSTIGKGSFCVMKGEITDGKGNVKVEIHNSFKILLSIILCVPIIAILISFVTGTEEFSLFLIVVVLLQILMIRYIFIEFAFKSVSNTSLQRLRDVLDVEWTK